MESAPLIKAHDHARAAALAHSDTTVAINEHALAAGEFANAAKSTSSAEALRTLQLLEQHHRRLSELLKLPLDNRSSSASHGNASQESGGADKRKEPAGTEGSSSKADETAGASDGSRRVGSTGSPAQQQRRYPPSRELSSSIASNLASARGIRSKFRGQPLAPSVSNDQAPGSVDTAANKDGSRSKMQSMLEQRGKPSWLPPSQPQAGHRSEAKEFTEQKVERSEEQRASRIEDGYSRFYNTFGSLINRLSAPLAFAGLPLIAEEPTASQQLAAASPDPAAPRKQQRGGVSAPSATQAQIASPGADPNLNKIYSKATLRALGTHAGGHGANDSFYFVPTTGGTVSYANILSFAQKEKRRVAASAASSIHGYDTGVDDADMLADAADDEDFVDARESQSSLSPGVKRRIGKSQTSKDLQNAVEELYTENKGLKDMLDKLSKRLHAFEANAQNSHLALQSSMRFMRPGSPLSLSVSGGKKDGGGGGSSSEVEGLRKKNKELEEELARMVKRMEAVEKECSRQQKTIMQYRDRWEKLKAGAKARRGAQEAGADTGVEAAGP